VLKKNRRVEGKTSNYPKTTQSWGEARIRIRSHCFFVIGTDTMRKGGRVGRRGLAKKKAEGKS